LEKKVTEILGWQDVEQVMPLVEKCIKAGSEKGQDSEAI
jgi:inorganic pyrophosphatase